MQRNIFLNWQGSSGSNFVLIGEDGNPYHEAMDVLIENNLMIGNSVNIMRAPFGVKGGKDITFRHNTVAGDLPSMAYAMRLNREGSNPANENVSFFNNVWSDPCGTMGAENASRPNDFSDTPPTETVSFQLDHNLYWNGGDPIPLDGGELINYTDDAACIVADPKIADNSEITIPQWNEITKRFNDGSSTIRQVFEKLVEQYGKLPSDSPAIDAADPNHMAQEDILGKKRASVRYPDIGAFECRKGLLFPVYFILLED